MMEPLTYSVNLRSRDCARGKRLYLDICCNGKRHTESLHLFLTGQTTAAGRAADRKTMRMAEAIRAQRVLEYQRRALGVQSEECAEVGLYEFIDTLMASKQKGTRQSWGQFRKYLWGYCDDMDLRLSRVDRKWVKGFRDFLDRAEAWSIDGRKKQTGGQPLGEGTKGLMFQKLRAVLNAAVREGLLKSNPALSVRGFGKVESVREFLTQEELRRLAATERPDDVVCRAFLFSCMTGLRWSDIVGLRWGDIEDMGERRRIVFKQRKTGGLEYLDLNGQAVRIMGEPGKGLVFDGALRCGSARNAVGAWVRAAGIGKHITFHCGRHTFAVMMLDLGVDVYTVSKLLGHRSIATTQVYAKILDKNKQAAVDRIPDLGL